VRKAPRPDVGAVGPRESCSDGCKNASPIATPTPPVEKILVGLSRAAHTNGQSPSAPGRLFADFETLSPLSLPIVGSVNYLRHKRTRPLVLFWAVDDGDVHVWKWGESIEPLLAAIKATSLFVSHGAFDRICWNVHMVPLGLPPIPIEGSEDNMVRCAKAGIPSGLGKAAEALKFPPELQKLDGRIALEMSRPREPRLDEDPDGTYALDDPEKWAKLIEYGKRDVEVLRALHNTLPPLTELDRLDWICSEYSNETGIYLDGLAIDKACELIEIAQQEANTKLQRLTNGEIKTIGQRDKILAWLNASGAGLKDLQAETLAEFLKRPDLTDEVRGIIESRYEAADAAPLKARGMRARRWEDGCAYHVFSFWGAVTGRWTSSGVQLHNVKSEGEGIAEKFAAVLSGDPERVRQFGPIMRVVGDALRAVVCARPGFRFLGMDFSGIESSVLAGLAGERWKVEQWKKFFRTRDSHDDPYFIIGKWLGFADRVARQYGKVADLAFGYGGSIGAWRRFAPAGDTTSNEQIKKYRDIWRQRHPATRQYLKGLDEAVTKTVQSRALTFFGRLTIHCQTVAGHNWFYIRLPSGRSIPYPFAEIKNYTDKNGRPAAGVAFMDYQNKKWRPYKSPTGHPVIWPGLLIENVTQGIARDLLAATLVRLWAANYPPTLHVHDEVVVEVPVNSGHSLEEYKTLCERRPDWAVEMDIPVFAKVWERQRWAEGVDIPVQHVAGGIITPDQLVNLHKNKVEEPKPIRPTTRTRAKRPPQDAPVVEATEFAARLAPCSSHQSTAPIEIAASTIAVPLVEVASVAPEVEPAPLNMTPGETLNILGQARTDQPAHPAEPDDNHKVTKGNGRSAPESEEARQPPPEPFFDLIDVDGELVFAESLTAEWTGQSRCLPAALAYARVGWTVFPAPAGTKKSHKSAEHSGGVPWGASQNPAILKRDFTRWRYANIGIPTGKDNGFFVVEVDTKAGHANLKADGLVSLRQITERYGPLPQTLQAISPSGSKHFYFEWPEGQTIHNSASKLAPGIDVRGEGGMVIAPPSTRDGVGAYRWVTNVAPAKAPAWLLRLIQDRAKGDPIKHEPNLAESIDKIAGELSVIHNLRGSIDDIEAALAVIPNDDAPWESPDGISWNGVGMATFAASGGSGEGLRLFDKWSQKSVNKYDHHTTLKKWLDYHHSPPTRKGFGSLVYWADQADPDWRDKPKQLAPDELDEWDAGELLSGPPPTPREWLIARYFCRGFLSGLVAPGDVGKTTLRLTQAIELASGRKLLGQRIYHRCKVLILSFEDDRKELHRRLLAICRHHKIDPQELKGWLFCRDIITGPKLAELDAKGKRRQVGALDGILRRAIARRQCALVILDPFIKLHLLNENDNPDMNFVCELLIKIAQDYNIAVDCPAHTHKGAIQAGDADARRGASAQRDAGRLDYTLTAMTEDEAKRFGINAGERKRYMRLDKAKANIVRAMKAVWFQLVNVPIDNKTETYPEGDEVQAAERWDPPETWTGIEPETLNAILDDLDAGLPNGSRYSTHSRATDRAAWQVAQKHCPDKTEAQCREIIKVWCDGGVLVEELYFDPVSRKRVKGLQVAPSKRPTYQ
jgi:hypothetical protein